MDQIKKILAQAAKHQFWIAIGFAVLVSGVAWYLTQSKLQQLYSEQENLIKSKYSDMERVRAAISTHPNESSRIEMERMIGSLTDDVRQAWAEQYQRQAEFLKWPDIGLPRLISKLQRYYPVELTLEYPDQPRDITEGEKTSFSKYFDEQMPKLAEIIGVKWVGTSSSAGGMGMGGMGMGPGGGMGMGPGGMGMGGMGMGPGGGGDYGDDGAGDFGGSGFGMGPGGMMGGGMGGIGGRRTVSRDVVRWPKPSQDELLNSIRLWQGDKPDVYQMIYTQENVWILEGLFNIIARTNIVPQTQKPATANIQAAVKEIEFIRIGSSAIGDAGDVLFAAGGMGGMGMGGMGMGGMGMGGMGMGGMGDGDDGGMGMGMGMGGGGDFDDGMGMGGGGYGDYGDDGGMGMGGMGMGGMGMRGTGGMEGGGPGGPGSGGRGRPRDPAHRRYVDAAFKPISGEDLRSRIKSESPEDAYFAVAKRVPVRMRVTLDIRRLQEFIANCGNEGLMLEVRQVRLGNTSPAGIGGGAGMGGMGMGGMGMGMGGRGMGGFGGMDAGDDGMGMGMGMGGMDEGGMGMGGMGMGGMGMGMGGPGGGLGGMRASRRNMNEMKVELYGIVYLFYPVNIDRLGLSKIEEGFELQDSVEDTEDVVVEEAAAEAGENANAEAAEGAPTNGNQNGNGNTN